MATLGWFNRLEPAVAIDTLVACCASQGWAQTVANGRPYQDRAALLDTGAAAFASLDAAAVRTAVDAHPRIGERADAGGAPSGREANWSAQEQSAAATTTAAARTELTTVNAAYEQRFGHVFLICATGLTTEDVVAAARRRLANDPATEWAEVTAELGRIVRLRLAKLVSA